MYTNILEELVESLEDQIETIDFNKTGSLFVVKEMIKELVNNEIEREFAEKIVANCNIELSMTVTEENKGLFIRLAKVNVKAIIKYIEAIYKLDLSNLEDFVINMAKNIKVSIN